MPAPGNTPPPAKGLAPIVQIVYRNLAHSAESRRLDEEGVGR